MNSNKPRVIKAFEKLDTEIKEQIKLSYPEGFSDNLITFTNKDGLLVSALPFETDDKYYLIKMSVYEAERIIEEDDDYDSDGVLRTSVRNEYSEKHSDIDYLSDVIADDSESFSDDSYDDDSYDEKDTDNNDDDEDDED